MEIKLFNKWDTNIEVKDLGLKPYISLTPLFVPRTGGRNVKIRFHKSKNNIVERLMGKLMVPGHRGKKHKVTSGHISGKGIHVYNTVKKTFEIIEKELKVNPIEVLVRAIENSAPRDEITSIEYGGARYPQAVDCSPQRRVDLALKNIVHGAYNKSFNTKKKIEKSLAEEIISAYKNESASNAISKKIELERQADSAR